MSETVDHPAHYGGAGNPHEAIECIEAHGLGFSLGNAVKYVFRAGKKGDAATDLRKAAWYLDREVMARAGEIVHACPPGDAGRTPCCDRTPFDLGHGSRLSTNPAEVTCGDDEAFLTRSEYETLPPWLRRQIDRQLARLR